MHTNRRTETVAAEQPDQDEALAQRLAAGRRTDNLELLKQVLSRNDAAVIARAIELARTAELADQDVANVAREILDRHDPYGSELRDNAFVRSMLAEAYARGFEAGAAATRSEL